MTSRSLKLIALITMTLDHTGAMLDLDFLRVIGRIAFPLYAFMIAEGMYHSKDKLKYIKKLFIFAIISEPFFNFFLNKAYSVEFGGLGNFLNPEYQNVFFTLAIGGSLCYIFSTSMPVAKKIILYFVACISGYYLKQDYYLVGSFYILGLYYFRGNFKMVSIISVIFLMSIYLGLPYYYIVAALISLIFIKLYNGEKGRFKNEGLEKFFQWFQYAYYPLHLLLLGIFF